MTLFYDQAEHMFDQNATIKEMDEDDDDLASEMVNIEPGKFSFFLKLNIPFCLKFSVLIFSHAY